MKSFSSALAAVGLLAATGCGDGGGDPQPTPSPAVINGTCAPHGEVFTNVYSCATVQGPSPTSSDPASSKVNNPDPDRLNDPDITWVREELDACSCICCHTSVSIGAYVWAYDFGPVWTDSMSDEVLLIYTDAGPGTNQIPPAQNNGFSRAEIGVPTTDATRFKAYIDREIVRRGL